MLFGRNIALGSIWTVLLIFICQNISGVNSQAGNKNACDGIPYGPIPNNSTTKKPEGSTIKCCNNQIIYTIYNSSLMFHSMNATSSDDGKENITISAVRWLSFVFWKIWLISGLIYEFCNELLISGRRTRNISNLFFEARKQLH